MIARMRAGLAMTCFVIAAVSARGSQPATPRKVYTNKLFFSVPLKIDEADRVKIASLKCHVKPPGGAWTVAETGNSQTARFNYHASNDGEYLFSFSTVDATGRESPGKIDNEPPRLIVVVDTKQPEFLVAPVSVASGMAYVQCTMRDANPDMTTVTAEAEGADGSFTPLLPVDTSVPGFFCVPASGMPARVRVGGKDKAGNVAQVVLAVSAVTPPSPQPKIESPVVVAPLPKPVLPVAPPTLAKLEPIAAPLPKNIGSGLMVPEPIAKPVVKAENPGEPAPVAAPPREIILPAVPRVTEKIPAESLPQPASAADKIIGSHRCVLNYVVDGIDPSAVQKVEAFCTQDEGKTWKKLGEDSDRKSPIEFQLPADGRYGIIIGISTADRLAAEPAAGEQPDWWIEADTTIPEVTLESATPGIGDDAGQLILKWHVHDKNLKPDAVEFAWSNGPEGPWQTIAKGLRAEGLYRWPVPREAGSKAYLKIETQDKAGNVGRAATSQPVSVEVNRPRAKVLGLNPAAMKQ